MDMKFIWPSLKCLKLNKSVKKIGCHYEYLHNYYFVPVTAPASKFLGGKEGKGYFRGVNKCMQGMQRFAIFMLKVSNLG